MLRQRFGMTVEYDGRKLKFSPYENRVGGLAYKLYFNESQSLTLSQTARQGCGTRDGSVVLLIRRRGQQVAVVHTLDGVDLNFGFFLSGEGHLGKD